MTSRLLITCFVVWFVSYASLPAAGHDKTAQHRPAPLTVQRTEGLPVILQAESLDYFERERRLIATGNVVVTHGKTRLFADRIELSTETGIGTATGHVRFLTPEDDIQASQLDFNLSTEQGLLYDASGVLAEVYQISGERIALIDAQRAKVHRGRLTTCTDAVPDWEFRTAKADIHTHDYVKLRQPSFWIKGIPVFYLPYFIFPIKDKRATGFLAPTFGQRSEDGVSVREDFYWAITDWMDATVGLEYLSERGFLPHGQFRYAIDPLSDGQIDAAYIQDRKTDDTLWRVLIQQRQAFGWGVRGLTHIDLRGQNDILRAFSNDIQLESQVTRISFGALTKQFADSAIILHGNSNDGIPASGATGQFRHLPALSFQQFQTPLLGVAFFSIDAAYNRLSSTNVVDDTPVNRLDFFPNITLPLTWAPWVRFAATGGIRRTFYDHQTTTANNTTRQIGELGAHLQGPTLRRRYNGAQGGQTIVHTIESQLTYRYVSDVDQDDIPPFETLDENRHLLDPLQTMPLIDRIEAANFAKLSVTNSLFVQNLNAAPAHRIRQVARLTLSQGFDIRGATATHGNLLGFSDVEIELNLWYRWYMVAALRLDAATRDLKKSTTRVLLAIAPGWSAHLAHQYRVNPDIHYVTGGVGTSPFPWLQATYNARYDVLTRTFLEHHISFALLGQCWRIDMAFRIRNAEDTPFFSNTSFTIKFHLLHI
jgi:LPS-assembly protein